MYVLLNILTSNRGKIKLNAISIKTIIVYKLYIVLLNYKLSFLLCQVFKYFYDCKFVMLKLKFSTFKIYLLEMQYLITHYSY